MTDDKRKEIVDWAFADFRELVELIEFASTSDSTLATVKRILADAGVPATTIDKASDAAQLKKIRRAS